MTHHSSFPVSARPASAGFALFEVLICILVLTVGMIGAAMMQLHASRTTEQSSVHDTALALASQIADELRANDEQARLLAGNPFLQFRYPASPSGNSTTDCYSQDCNTQQLAEQSMRDWTKRAELVLRNGGKIEICRDPAMVAGSGAPLDWCPGSGSTDVNIPVSVKIGWQERDADGRDVADQSPRLAVLVSPFSQ